MVHQVNSLSAEKLKIKTTEHVQDPVYRLMAIVRNLIKKHAPLQSLAGLDKALHGINEDDLSLHNTLKSLQSKATATLPDISRLCLSYNHQTTITDDDIRVTVEYLCNHFLEKDFDPKDISCAPNHVYLLITLFSLQLREYSPSENQESSPIPKFVKYLCSARSSFSIHLFTLLCQLYAAESLPLPPTEDDTLFNCLSNFYCTSSTGMGILIEHCEVFNACLYESNLRLGSTSKRSRLFLPKYTSIFFLLSARLRTNS